MPKWMLPKDQKWLEKAKVGDKVYLVKEDRYCHIESELLH